MKLKNRDYFLDYTEEDIKYELTMLIRCKLGLRTYTDSADPFLKFLCLEGWLLHTRRLIEVFGLATLDNKWKKRWGSISEHLSHANPSNRTDPRLEKRENPKWGEEEYYYELIDAIQEVADRQKSEYAHYDLLAGLLKSAKDALILGSIENMNCPTTVCT
jgi:hypothetical protein